MDWHQIEENFNQIIDDTLKGCPAGIDLSSWHEELNARVRRLKTDVASQIMQNKPLTAEDKKLLEKLSELNVIKGGKGIETEPLE